MSESIRFLIPFALPAFVAFYFIYMQVKDVLFEREVAGRIESFAAIKEMLHALSEVWSSDNIEKAKENKVFATWLNQEVERSKDRIRKTNKKYYLAQIASIAHIGDCDEAVSDRSKLMLLAARIFVAELFRNKNFNKDSFADLMRLLSHEHSAVREGIALGAADIEDSTVALAIIGLLMKDRNSQVALAAKDSFRLKR